jgi:nucleoside-diphosphate-sugar epimerase
MQSRLIYDSTATVALGGFLLIWTRLAWGDLEWVLLALPFLVLALNYLVGIYGRFRAGAGIVKGGLFAISCVFSGLLGWLLGLKWTLAVLWVPFSWALLALPRIFLNLSNKVATRGFVRRTIQGRGPVLIVGGGGYIGTHVVTELLAAGFSVRVLDRLLYGKEPVAAFLGNPLFELVEGDATDLMKLIPAMEGASAVIHLAGLVGDPACAVDEAFTRHANVVATRIVKDMALTYGVERFIFASSCSVYGLNDEEVDETSPLNPVSLYAKTKIDSEKELLLCQVDDFCVTILRFATVFGHSKRPRFDLVGNLFTAQAFTDGKITLIGPQQWRPFVHVRDLARAIVITLKAKPEIVRNQIFNVGDRRLNMTIGQLCESVREIVSRERPVEVVTITEAKDLRNYAVSFEKIETRLGFSAATMLEEGIREIVENFKAGNYANYRNEGYSNLEMTRKALHDFKDPIQSARLYSPIAGNSVSENPL